MKLNLPSAILLSRVSIAREYLSALESDSHNTWETLYEEYKQGLLSAPRTMALLLPEHYSETADTPNSKVRKSRHFPVSLAPTERCQAVKLWGYECPLIHVSAVHADHQFPFGLGGVTDPRNRLWLCDVHNRLKSADVHFYPWDEPLAEWVRQALSDIASKRRFGAVVGDQLKSQ